MEEFLHPWSLTLHSTGWDLLPNPLIRVGLLYLRRWISLSLVDLYIEHFGFKELLLSGKVQEIEIVASVVKTYSLWYLSYPSRLYCIYAFHSLHLCFEPGLSLAPELNSAENRSTHMITTTSLRIQLTIFFLFKKNFYWSIVDLQCCVCFRCTARGISYT